MYCRLKLPWFYCGIPSNHTFFSSPSFHRRFQCVDFPVGPTAPSAEQQLTICKSHLQIILGPMTTVIRCVTHLDISVQHTILQSSMTDACVSCVKQPSSDSCSWSPEPLPDSLQEMVSTVLESIAPAVPSLQTLGIGSSCDAATIRIFSLQCLKLNSLVVDAMTKPATALRDLSNHLPRLTHLTLRACHANTTSMHSIMTHLQNCAMLTVLELDISSWLVQCDPDCWDLAPTSLTEFSYDCFMIGSPMSPKLCARLRHLSTCEDLGEENLQQFLDRYPLLQKLNFCHWLNDGSVELLGSGNPSHGISAPRHVSLKERIAAGFDLNCSGVTFSGSSEEVQTALEWLPPLPLVTGCTMRLTGTSHINCLGQIARVLPNLESFVLKNEETQWEQFPVHTDAEFISPVLACRSLKYFNMLMHVDFSTLGLSALCNSLPLLVSLSYVECKAVNPKILKEVLGLMKRDINLKTYTQGDFHA